MQREPRAAIINKHEFLAFQSIEPARHQDEPNGMQAHNPEKRGRSGSSRIWPISAEVDVGGGWLGRLVRHWALLWEHQIDAGQHLKTRPLQLPKPGWPIHRGTVVRINNCRKFESEEHASIFF